MKKRIFVGLINMFKSYFKIFIFFIMLVCISLSTFACGNTSSESLVDSTSDSLIDSTSESQPASSGEDKIKAVIGNEPDGYTVPKFDFINKKFTQPALTDEEMYAVVFESRSEIVQPDKKGNYPDPDYELGEACFSFTTGTEFDEVYKCSGISTDIDLSDEFSTYKIIANELSPTSTSTAPVNNAYWHKYFKVMLTNLDFQVSASDESDYTVFAYVYDNGSENETKYAICSDGFVRTKQSDGTISISDKKVDAPKIYMVATLFGIIHNTNYMYSHTSVSLPNEKVTFHYNGKTATIDSVDAVKLGYTDQTDDPMYDITKTFINETFMSSDDYIYIDFGNETKYYVIDSNNNLYYVWNGFYSTKIIGGYVSMQYQNARQCKGVFDYSKIVELFK